MIHLFFIFFMVFVFPAHADVTDGLVGWWKLDETSGSNATDSSGNGNIGTLMNGPSWTVGCKKGGCLNFDQASSQYVTAGNSVNLRTSFSTSAWIKRTGTLAPGSYEMYLANGLDAGNGWATYIHNNSGTYEYRFLKGGLAVISSGISNDQNAWRHVVWVVDASARPSLYIDGALVYSSSDTTAISVPTGTRHIGADNHFTLGARSYFTGYIDDIRIYNRALNANEVTAIYQAGTPRFSLKGSARLNGLKIP